MQGTRVRALVWEDPTCHRATRPHRLQTRRLSSCGSRAQLLRGTWDLPRPGLEPLSPALAGGFSTTAPPGEPRIQHFKVYNSGTSLVVQWLQTRRLSNCGSRAQSLRGMWDLPRPGLEPVSPALAGRFSTTAPPGKPECFLF
ncbi:hypothetical protein J1605_018016 [Eschrichtius robustus]|uniref:Uncharacterized protein n=1 Tax=Eschrichtius robustus TaxID=9764 RepID=A0AB34HW18_ESCRO|nr:hypothetical protein J1605_018016 [Eschrichtius robustus]